MSQTVNHGVGHSRSVSPSTMYTNSCLPPLSPIPPSESSRASSNSNLYDVSTEDVDVSSHGRPMNPSMPWENAFIPPRVGHRRSNSSDLLLGFCAMAQPSPPSNQESVGRWSDKGKCFGNDKLIGFEFGYVNSEGEVVDDLVNSLINMDDVNAMNSNGARDFGESFNSNTRVKRSCTGDIAPSTRHSRSLSVDSAMVKYEFGDDYLNGNSSKPSLEFGNGEFNDLDLKKIMKDEKLAEIAGSDPKRAKRILANRQSAARSKERKVRYISELEHKVQTLQTEATTLSAQVTVLQKEYADLTTQNNELKFRVQAMEQHAKLKDALSNAMTAEIQRLKLGNLELRDDKKMQAASASSTTPASA